VRSSYRLPLLLPLISAVALFYAVDRVSRNFVNILFFIWFAGTWGLIIWVIVQRNKKENERLAEIKTIKPEFSRFYREWKAIKNKEELIKGLAVAGALAAVIGVAAVMINESSRDNR